MVTENKIYKMEILKEYLDLSSFAHSFGYLLSAFVLFFVGKVTYRFLNPKINIQSELVEKDNLAFIISYVGYFGALLAILVGAISGESHGFLNDILLICIFSILGIILLHISIILANKFILSGFSIKKEILDDQNEGTGLIEAAVYLGNGFILFGALVGESASLNEGIITFITYWAIGNLILIISSKIFSLWIPYDIHKEIEKDNVAAGTAFSGAFIGISIILMNALMDPFISWTNSIIDILLYSLLGVILLPVMRFITDKIILTGQNLNDEICNQEKPNIGAGLIEAFSYIGAAILILWAF